MHKKRIRTSLKPIGRLNMCWSVEVGTGFVDLGCIVNGQLQHAYVGGCLCWDLLICHSPRTWEGASRCKTCSSILLHRGHSKHHLETRKRWGRSWHSRKVIVMAWMLLAPWHHGTGIGAMIFFVQFWRLPGLAAAWDELVRTQATRGALAAKCTRGAKECKGWQIGKK